MYTGLLRYQQILASFRVRAFIYINLSRVLPNVVHLNLKKEKSGYREMWLVLHTKIGQEENLKMESQANDTNIIKINGFCLFIHIFVGKPTSLDTRITSTENLRTQDWSTPTWCPATQPGTRFRPSTPVHSRLVRTGVHLHGAQQHSLGPDSGPVLRCIQG